METNSQKYFNLKEEIDNCNYRLNIFRSEPIKFKEEITETISSLKLAEDEMKAVVTLLSQENENVSIVCKHLILSFNDFLNASKKARRSNMVLSFNQGTILRGNLFWIILRDVIDIITFEGAARPISKFKESQDLWDISGVEGVISSSIQKLSDASFHNLYQIIDFSEVFGEDLIVEFEKVDKVINRYNH